MGLDHLFNLLKGILLRGLSREREHVAIDGRRALLEPCNRFFSISHWLAAWLYVWWFRASCRRSDALQPALNVALLFHVFPNIPCSKRDPWKHPPGTPTF